MTRPPTPVPDYVLAGYAKRIRIARAEIRRLPYDLRVLFHIYVSARTALVGRHYEKRKLEEALALVPDRSRYSQEISKADERIIEADRPFTEARRGISLALVHSNLDPMTEAVVYVAVLVRTKPNELFSLIGDLQQDPAYQWVEDVYLGDIERQVAAFNTPTPARGA